MAGHTTVTSQAQMSQQADCARSPKGEFTTPPRGSVWKGLNMNYPIIYETVPRTVLGEEDDVESDGDDYQPSDTEMGGEDDKSDKAFDGSSKEKDHSDNGETLYAKVLRSDNKRTSGELIGEVKEDWPLTYSGKYASSNGRRNVYADFAENGNYLRRTMYDDISDPNEAEGLARDEIIYNKDYEGLDEEQEKREVFKALQQSGRIRIEWANLTYPQAMRRARQAGGSRRKRLADKAEKATAKSRPTRVTKRTSRKSAPSSNQAVHKAIRPVRSLPQVSYGEVQSDVDQPFLVQSDLVRSDMVPYPVVRSDVIRSGEGQSSVARSGALKTTVPDPEKGTAPRKMSTASRLLLEFTTGKRLWSDGSLSPEPCLKYSGQQSRQPVATPGPAVMPQTGRAADPPTIRSASFPFSAAVTADTMLDRARVFRDMLTRPTSFEMNRLSNEMHDLERFSGVGTLAHRADLASRVVRQGVHEFHMALQAAGITGEEIRTLLTMEGMLSPQAPPAPTTTTTTMTTPVAGQNMG